jgi:seryl-tRNA synthetase
MLRNILGKFIYSKNSIKSKQFALSKLSADSTKVTGQIQSNIAKLQATNGEIDSTIKEIADMQTQYTVLNAELENRKKQNENIIAMFSSK